jgi:RNA polymerase sigma-70 factor (ECF subfamily)
VRAYQHLRDFAGEAQFSTWLTRIAVNEALSRRRHRQRVSDLAYTDDARRQMMDLFESPTPGPERQLLEAETRRILESAIDDLPDAYRVVFVLREIEEMNTAEAAACLDLTEETVKVRLHRARRMLRRELCARTGSASTQAFQFMGERCDRVVRSVLDSLSAASGPEAR